MLHLNDPKDFRKFTIMCQCFFMLIIGTMIGLIVYGNKEITFGQDYIANSTNERCEIIDVTLSNCDYDRRTDKYYGVDPTYTIIASDKCGNNTLSQTDGTEYGCIDKAWYHYNNTKLINTTHDCHVYKCNEFSFNGYHIYKMHNYKLIDLVFIP